MKKSPSLFFRLMADDAAALAPVAASVDPPPTPGRVSSNGGLPSPAAAAAAAALPPRPPVPPAAAAAGGQGFQSRTSSANSMPCKGDSCSEIDGLGRSSSASSGSQYAKQQQQQQEADERAEPPPPAAAAGVQEKPHLPPTAAAAAAAAAAAGGGGGGAAAGGLSLQLAPQEVLHELLGDLYVDATRLTIGELLGQGGFAEVHASKLADRLVHSVTSDVAVKQLRPEVLASAEDLREFLLEANLLRKLRHSHIVRLVGVGAANCTDLVSMRRSMYVVQELMGGGDLKALLLRHMSDPWAGVYTKVDALKWAMQIAEALSYLHEVCRPLIIHRDLKADNILLTGGPSSSATAKLADFGLHKRVRKMAASDAWVTWRGDDTYRGDAYERSYYGGNTYLAGASVLEAMKSVHGGSAWAATAAGGGGGGVGGSGRGGNAWGGGGAGGGGSARGGNAWNGAAAAAAGGGGASEMTPGDSIPAASAAAGGVGSLPAATLNRSSASASYSNNSSSAALLQSAVRARQMGVLGDDELATHILAGASRIARSSSGPLTTTAGGDGKEGSSSSSSGGGGAEAAAAAALMASTKDVSVHRKWAASQALDRSVHGGRQMYAAGAAAGAAGGGSGSGGGSRGSAAAAGGGGGSGSGGRNTTPAAAAAGGGGDGYRAILATQAVGSPLYMAPEVIRGDPYNEKVDVFSFGIILFELFTGFLLGARVTTEEGGREELEAYSQKVAAGHREEIPEFWHPALKSLVSSCWAGDPAARPSFRQVLKQLYALKQAGVAEAMDAARPKGDYNPVGDCGCGCVVM